MSLRGAIQPAVWSGSGFVCFGGILLCGLSRLVGFIDSWIWLVRGFPGHGWVHLLVAGAAEIGFSVGLSCAGLVSSWVTFAE